MKILIIECAQEVSSFNPVPSHYDDFVVLRGNAIFEAHRQERWEIGGALSIFEARPDVELVPTYSARAITSGGTLARVDWERIAKEFLDALRAAPPCDGAYFRLHGAMSAESENDPEGFLLQEARKILGEKIPIVISLDLHGIFTDRMAQHINALVVYHTYPHVDFYTTGQRAARLLLKIVEGKAKPVIAKMDVPVLARGDEMITATGSIKHVIEAAQRVENSAGGLSAGMFWGNPFTDVPELRSNSVVVMDGDAERAAREATNLADIFWEYHDRMRVPLTSLRDAAQIATEHYASGKGGTVVLVDAADATSSGASGDSNAIWRALNDAGFAGSGLFPLVDAPAVQAAFAAGVGKNVRVNLGGALDKKRYTPIAVDAHVHMLSEGLFRNEHAKALYNAGPTAVFKIGKHTIIATSRAVSLFDRSLFYAHGQYPKDFDVVVVKSPHCEHHMFKEWAARYIDVDAPGATSADVRSLGHAVAQRPLWPLDPDVSFTPKVKIFQR